MDSKTVNKGSNPVLGYGLMIVLITLLALNLVRMEFFSSSLPSLLDSSSSSSSISRALLREDLHLEEYDPDSEIEMETLGAGRNGQCRRPQPSKDFKSLAHQGSIFNELSEFEHYQIVEWFLTSSNLSLVAWADAGEFDSYINEIAFVPPPKAEVLEYLDNNGPEPARRARVVVYHGALSPPVVREYYISPIPSYPEDPNVVLTNVFFNGITDIPFDARTPDTKTYDILEELVVRDTEYIADILLDSYGTTYSSDGCTEEYEGCLYWTDTAPGGVDHQMALWFTLDVEAVFANTIGLVFVYNMGGTDPEAYNLAFLVYNGQYFASLDAFKTAYNSSSLIKIENRPLLPYLLNSKYGEEWSSLRKAPNENGIHTDNGKKTRLNSNFAAPQVVNPAGQRFFTKKNHVEYLGWHFHLNLGRRGLRFYDVRYRGERILYEAGMSEAFAHYSGVNDPIQAGSIYIDSSWGLGYSTNSAIRGVDCPATGTLLPFSYFWDSDETTTIEDAICIFEMDLQSPIRRHLDNSNWDGTYVSYGGLPGTALVVRVLNTVYNYDYVIDHIFHVNGAFEIKSATSGYLQASFWSTQFENEMAHYGTKIHDFTAGTLHDHVLAFKLDVDILGRQNSVLKTVLESRDYVPEDINGAPYPLSSVATDGNWKTKHLTTTLVESELGLEMTYQNPSIFRIINNDYTNSWGNNRGYRVKINGAIHSVVGEMDSLRAFSFVKYHMAFTLHKDEEHELTSTHDQYEPTGTLVNPSSPRAVVSLDDMLNAESIDDQDVVLWAMVGTHHLPSAEDIPVTNTIGNAGHIYLLPFNMFDYDDDMDLGNSIYANPADDPIVSLYDLKKESRHLCPIKYARPGKNSLQNYAEE